MTRFLDKYCRPTLGLADFFFSSSSLSSSWRFLRCGPTLLTGFTTTRRNEVQVRPPGQVLCLSVALSISLSWGSYYSYGWQSDLIRQAARVHKAIQGLARPLTSVLFQAGMSKRVVGVMRARLQTAVVVCGTMTIAAGHGTMTTAVPGATTSRLSEQFYQPNWQKS